MGASAAARKAQDRVRTSSRDARVLGAVSQRPTLPRVARGTLRDSTTLRSITDRSAASEASPRGGRTHPQLAESVR
jgi:hypothetical protein